MQYKKIKNNFFENCIEKFYLFDWKFFILIFLLIGVGLLTLYSVDTGNKNYLFKHFIRINIALLFFLLISKTFFITSLAIGAATAEPAPP